MIGNARLHRGRYSQRLVNPDEVVPDGVRWRGTMLGFFGFFDFRPAGACGFSGDFRAPLLTEFCGALRATDQTAFAGVVLASLDTFCDQASGDLLVGREERLSDHGIFC